MNNRIILLLLMLCLLASSAFAQSDELMEFKLDAAKETKPVKYKPLTVDSSFLLDTGNLNAFFKYASCLQVSNDLILVADNNGNRVLAFDLKGRYVRDFGRLGRGPGEIQSPIWLQPYENKYYLANNNGIDIFEKDFRYDRRIMTFIATKNFSLAGKSLFVVVRGQFQQKEPFIVEMDLNGTIKQQYFADKETTPEARIDRSGSVIPLANQIVYLHRHWNKMLEFNYEGKVISSNSIKYKLLDKLEKWNDRPENKRENSGFRWFSNMFVGAKGLKGRIFIMIYLPYVDIIEVDLHGNILNHYLNDKDFNSMRWFDFAPAMQNGQVVFYVSGFSEGMAKNPSMSENSVYRLIPVK